jgi:hypothetical protein
VAARRNQELLKLAFIGGTLIAITVVIHAVGTTAWGRYLLHRHDLLEGFRGMRQALYGITSTVVVMISLHAVQIAIWAFAYRQLLPDGELPSFEAALYFSFVTFTTLGYGDITLTEGWRLLSGIQALNGILLVGWTTAYLFAVVQKTWEGMSNTKQLWTNGRKQ